MLQCSSNLPKGHGKALTTLKPGRRLAYQFQTSYGNFVSVGDSSMRLWLAVGMTIRLSLAFGTYATIADFRPIDLTYRIMSPM